VNLQVKQRAQFLSIFVVPTMDSFVDDSYDYPYNANSRFSQLSERTYLNRAQPSEVSFNMFRIQLFDPILSRFLRFQTLHCLSLHQHLMMF
jgi:hypothetical protein